MIILFYLKNQFYINILEFKLSISQSFEKNFLPFYFSYAELIIIHIKISLDFSCFIQSTEI